MSCSFLSVLFVIVLLVLLVLPIKDLLFSFLFFRSSSLSVPASSLLSSYLIVPCSMSVRDWLVPRPYQLPAADAFRVTWSECLGRSSRILHRNVFFEKALEDPIEGQGKGKDKEKPRNVKRAREKARKGLNATSGTQFAILHAMGTGF